MDSIQLPEPIHEGRNRDCSDERLSDPFEISQPLYISSKLPIGLRKLDIKYEKGLKEFVCVS
jgi:hypothetical protein